MIVIVFAYSQSLNEEISKVDNYKLNDKIKSYLDISFKYIDIEPLEALKISKKALAMSEQISDFKLQLASLRQLAEIQSIIGNDKEELDYYEKGLKTAGQINDLDEEFIFSYLLGYYYSNRNRFNKALEYYLIAIDIIEKLKDKSDLPGLYNNLGGIYYKLSKYEDALKYFFKSLSLKESQDDYTLVTSQINIGNVYIALRNFPKALEYYKEALYSIADNIELPEYTIVLNNLGICYKSIGDYQKAIKYYNQALSIRKQLKDNNGIAISNNNLGTTYEDLGEYKKAEKYYLDALKIYQNSANYNGLATTLRNLGNISIKLDNNLQAKNYLDSAIIITYRHSLPSVRADIFYSYALLNSNLRNHKESDKYYNSYLILKDSLDNEEFREKIAQHQVLYDVEKKDREYRLLRLENEAQENAIKSQRQFILFLTIVAFLLVALSVVAIWFYKVRQKTAQLLTKQNQLLRESEENLRIINDTKDKFFSIISHDLRNPLSTIAVTVENLKLNHPYMPQEKLNGTIDTLSNTVKETNSLLSNLLDWSRSQTHRIDFSPKKFNYESLIKQTLPLFKSAAENKNITIKTSLERDLQIVADRQMIETVIRNLVSNAIKFTNPEGNISIVVTSNNGSIETSVIDNGVGINPESLDKIFRIDANIKTKGTMNETGTGLGLILCKEFIEKHGGNITASSKPNNGSKFTFYLPNTLSNEFSAENENE